MMEIVKAKLERECKHDGRWFCSTEWNPTPGWCCEFCNFKIQFDPFKYPDGIVFKEEPAPSSKPYNPFT